MTRELSQQMRRAVFGACDPEVQRRLRTIGLLSLLTIADILLHASAPGQTPGDDPAAAQRYAVGRRSPDRTTSLPSSTYTQAWTVMQTMPTYLTGTGVVTT